MTTQPPDDRGQLPPPGSLRCPRCSATVGPEQDWCLECGAPARTRLAPTPNWQLPTVAVAAIVLLAGALLAFAFVRLTDDGASAVGTTPTAVFQTAPPTTTAPAPALVAPPAVTLPQPGSTVPLPSATTTAPVNPDGPARTVPGQTTPPAATTPSPTTTTSAPRP